jgi:hypothetical protein
MVLPEVRDAVELFNLANTDSPDIRPHTELVLCVAAAQRLLGMEKKSKARELALEFAKALEDMPPERSLSDCRRPFPKRGKESPFVSSGSRICTRVAVRPPMVAQAGFHDHFGL